MLNRQNQKKRKICVITGTRADYGILAPVLKAIEYSQDLKLYIIATSMHLMREFGYTVSDISRDGFEIYEKLYISYKDDTGCAMARSVGEAVLKFSEVFERLSPDFIVVLGDRGEMLAAAIAANYLNIPVAHIHGGELSGHIDGILRHAITKLAHIHFAATQQARERIIKLGEEKWRVFISGAPALDRLLREKLPSKRGLFRKYGVGQGERFFLVVQHPVSATVKESGRQMATTLEALESFNVKIVVIYPNADAGGRDMIKAIKDYQRFNSAKVFKSIPHKDYLGLLKACSVLVGNSSSGIIEAPFFKTPAVNIGIRQNGRLRSANVIDAPCNKRAITRAVKTALYDKRFKKVLQSCVNLYGDGHAGARIAKTLSSIKTGQKLLDKKLTY